MKLAIVVGHNSASQGAVRKDTGETEFVWNGRLARRMERLAPDYGLDVRVFHRTPGGGYRNEIARVYDEVDAWGADGSVELHFNGAASAAATGTETLTSGTALSMRLAESVQREVVIALGLRDRGIRTRARQDRGGGSLHAGRAPAILIEPFFGSSPEGNRATDEDSEQERLADAVLRGSAEAFMSFPRADLSNSRTLRATAEQRSANRTSAVSQVAAAVSTAATGAREQIEQVPAIGGVSDWLPYITVGLIVVAFIATSVSNAKADAVDEARIDDHERAVR